MSIRSYSRAAIMRRLFNAPLQVLPDTAAVVLGAVGNRFDVGQLFVVAEGRTLQLEQLQSQAEAARIEISARAGADQIAPGAPANALMRVIAGVAFVEIRGELVAENGIGPMSGFTGYDGLRAQVLSADADENVKGIVVDVDSPGGEVSGLYELVKVLMARRGTKPMRAVVRNCGASAAYAVAACADEITLHPLGIAGSIGTMAMHADFSGQLEQEGIKVTLITAGDHKADGNPYEPLPADVRDRIASMIGKANDQFLAHVAAARGLSVDAVRAQQAQIYMGEEAVSARLVDKIMSWADSIDEFTQSLNGSGAISGGGNIEDEGGAVPPAPGAQSKQEQAMSDKNGAPAASEKPENDHASQEAITTARTQAVTAERERISQLVELDAESSVSEGLSGAISAGTSPGDYALQLARKGKEQQSTALAGARADAVKGDQLPEQRTNDGTKPQNRGEAAVARMRGKHKGLPASA